MGFLEKIGIRGSFKKNFGAIVMLAIAGSAIFGLPFFRFEYYDAYITTYNLTNTQMGVFGTIIGVFGIVSYLFGGMVADGLSIRKVISASLLVTGIAGLFHLLPLGFGGLMVIYSIWGISTTFAFAPACVKAVRVMAGKEDQGKAYGFYEGFGGVAGAVVAMIALAIFNWGVSQAGNDVAAMKAAILFYSITNIVTGLLAYALVRDNNAKLRAGAVSFKGFTQVIKSPAVWLIALVGFCNHVLCLSQYYYIPYTTNILGAAIAVGATLGVLRKWGGVASSVIGGYIADKVGTGRLMLFSYGLVFVFQIIMILVPAVPSSVMVVAILFVSIYMFFSMNMTVSWTMMTEGSIPIEYSGTAAGIICMVGAIPETFVSVLAGRIIDTYPGVEGYHLFFYFLAGITALGFILLLVWRAYLKRSKQNGADGEMSEEMAKQCTSCHGGVNTEDETPKCSESGRDDISVKSQMSCNSHLNVIDDDDISTKSQMSCNSHLNVIEDDDISVKSQMSCNCHLNVIDDDDE